MKHEVKKDITAVHTRYCNSGRSNSKYISYCKMLISVLQLLLGVRQSQVDAHGGHSGNSGSRCSAVVPPPPPTHPHPRFLLAVACTMAMATAAASPPPPSTHGSNGSSRSNSKYISYCKMLISVLQLLLGVRRSQVDAHGGRGSNGGSRHSAVAPPPPPPPFPPHSGVRDGTCGSNSGGRSNSKYILFC